VLLEVPTLVYIVGILNNEELLLLKKRQEHENNLHPRLTKDPIFESLLSARNWIIDQSLTLDHF
jgi:hypothetical protein